MRTSFVRSAVGKVRLTRSSTPFSRTFASARIDRSPTCREARARHERDGANVRLHEEDACQRDRRTPAEAMKRLIERYGRLSVEQLNEANTRLLLIDEVLEHVLGWPRETFNPEEYAAAVDEDHKGKRQWLDYHLKTGEGMTLRLVVEAKRAGKAFELSLSKAAARASAEAIATKSRPSAWFSNCSGTEVLRRSRYPLLRRHQWCAVDRFASIRPQCRRQRALGCGLLFTRRHCCAPPGVHRSPVSGWASEPSPTYSSNRGGNPCSAFLLVG